MTRLLFSFVCLCPVLLLAADNKDAFIDPANAGPDYALQGEYLGKDNEGNTWGGQVIALGDGKFDAVGYAGGLPGEGWKRGDKIHKVTGEAKDGTATLKDPADADMEVRIKDGVLTVTEKGKQVAELKKVERKSPTLGVKPPEGATVLFNGTNTDAFENGKMIEIGGEKLLAANGTVTKQKLGDHTLHLEFRTPFVPKARGQGRGNSGVYIQGRYECQVLDSFGLDGKDNECGGIYSINQPIVNMCLPPLTWQTYDIEFKAAKWDAAGKKIENARATIKHNGVVIHDNLELVKGTPGHRPEGPDPEHLHLQDHGNPVVFRNIWIVEKK